MSLTLENQRESERKRIEWMEVNYSGIFVKNWI